jgi:tol-pal system protein YbgF
MAQHRLARFGVAFVAWTLGAAAHAQLFKDDEARKAVIDVRTRVTAIEEADKSRDAQLAALAKSLKEALEGMAAMQTQNAQLVEQISTLRRSLLDLNNGMEGIRADLAKLRGSDEQLARDVAELQRRSRDVGQAIDDRLRRLEPVKVTIDGREHLVDQEERRAFDDAMATIRSGDFDRAVTSLAVFQRRYVGSPYTSQARFWYGNALYGKRDYKGAIEAFRAFVAGAPEHPRAPEAMLAVANSQAETKDVRGARKTIEDLIRTYPASEAAQAGRDRLPTLK